MTPHSPQRTHQLDSVWVASLLPSFLIANVQMHAESLNYLFRLFIHATQILRHQCGWLRNLVSVTIPIRQTSISFFCFISDKVIKGWVATGAKYCIQSLHHIKAPNIGAFCLVHAWRR